MQRPASRILAAAVAASAICQRESVLLVKAGITLKAVPVTRKKLVSQIVRTVTKKQVSVRPVIRRICLTVRRVSKKKNVMPTVPAAIRLRANVLIAKAGTTSAADLVSRKKNAVRGAPTATR